MEPDSYGKGIVTNSSVMFEFVYIDNSNLIVNTCFYNVENKRKNNMEEVEWNYFSNKIGNFCSENHFDDYLKSLSKEEYVALQHSFCVCSDD